MSPCTRILATATILATALPAAALAATKTPTRTGVDKATQVSFTLTGRSLVVNLRAIDGQPNPLMGKVPGTKVVVACRGTSPKDHKTRNTFADVDWPAGASTVTAKLARDVSDKPVWCLLEASDGADYAVTYKLRIPKPAA